MSRVVPVTTYETESDDSSLSDIIEKNLENGKAKNKKVNGLGFRW